MPAEYVLGEGGVSFGWLFIDPRHGGGGDWKGGDAGANRASKPADSLLTVDPIVREAST